MSDIRWEIGLAGKDILNTLDHMVERQYQLFQLNGHGLRVKANVEIFRGDILDLTADAADRRVTFMYRQ